MKILEKINWSVLNTYINNKLIIINKHPEYDIWILNYSKETQFTKAWDLYTTSCRGIVIDIEGNILARPFQKFKNYEEHDPSEFDWSEEFDAFEKMDGSLIILFYYKLVSKWIVASRGSFTSEQALEAQKMIDVNIYDKLNKRLTYLFEVLYPENRVVIDYGKRRELVLLAVIEALTGYEIPYESVLPTYSNYFTVAPKLDLKTFTELRELIRKGEDNKEGMVIRFKKSGIRLKMKYAEYIRLHAIVTNVSNLTVWKHLKNNHDFDELLDRVPDEFYIWVNKTVKSLQQEFNEIERLALKEFVRIYYTNNIINRKEFANEALKSEYQSILFKLYDKKLYNDIIWKSIRPVFGKPFKDGYES